MKDTFKLYINKQLVEFEKEPKFEFKYQQEDFGNPTIIKNNYTKSINIEGTDNNNQIFGEIYQLDREQLYKFNSNTGVYFNPSKRTPFELYKNSELIESGYMQLTDISIKNHKIIYNITLYGGLGDFFYSLMYNDNDEKLTLADLWYKIEDKNGKLLPKETELDFKINKDFVADSWTKLKDGATGNTINDFLTFAPAYNGLYEDFDSSSILVNTFASQPFGLENNKTDGGVEYSTYLGYKMAKTDREWTEWEVRDLRSYMQRPCLKFSKLFNAICDPDNNGGYKVNLSSSFFNSNNPYYGQAYMALPLLPTSLKDEESHNEEIYKLFIDKSYYPYSHIGNKGGSVATNAAYRLGFNGETLNATAENNFEINAVSIPITSKFDVKLDFDLKLVANSLDSTLNNEELFLTFVTQKESNPDYDLSAKLTVPTYRSVTVQAIMYEVGGDSYFYSNILNFTNQVTYNGKTYTSTADKWNNATGEDFSNVINVYGTFKRQGNSYDYKFTDKYGNSNFYLDIKDVPVKPKMAVAFLIKYRYSGLMTNEQYQTPVVNRTIFIKPYNDNGQSESKYRVNSYITAPLYNTSELIWKENSKTVRSNSTINKKQLLQTDFSPCDVLLDYCKLFGLYFTKDIHSKTINILTKNEFFTGNTVDISDRIDYNKDIGIKPFLFETKYYLMKSEPNETYYSKLYKNEYNLIYGQQRINTNYNFNKDTKNVYEGSVFQNAISVTDTSPYYRTFWQGGYFNQWPCWIMSSPTMELYNGVGTESMKVYEWPYPYTRFIDQALTVDWNTKSGYDMWPKTAFYNMDNNSKSLSDITASLLFFNGFKATKDAGDPNNDQATLSFWVTDDLVYMNTLNNGEVCYLYTEVPTDRLENIIGVQYKELPQFLRYRMTGNTVTESFDFGLPRELYMPNVTYGEDATLYSKFWKKYLTDRYDVNTRKVTCYVNLNGMKINQDTLRDFYYFDNCLWVINKIENHLSNDYGTTKVEFVKVNDTDSYMNAQQVYQYETISLNEYEATVDYNTSKYVVELTSTSAWSSTVENSGQEVEPSEANEGGKYRIELETEQNTDGENVVDNIFYFSNLSGQIVEFHLKQLPSPRNAKLMYGYVYDEKTQLPLKDYTIIINRGFADIEPILTNPLPFEPIIVEYSTKTNDEGYWELYVPKSITEVYVAVRDKNNEEVYSNIFYWKDLDNKHQLDIPV
jgi:hypothetical protein